VGETPPCYSRKYQREKEWLKPKTKGGRKKSVDSTKGKEGITVGPDKRIPLINITQVKRKRDKKGKTVFKSLADTLNPHKDIIGRGLGADFLRGTNWVKEQTIMEIKGEKISR